MDNRKTYKIEITRDELSALIYALGYVEAMEEDVGFLNLKLELEEIQKNG
jgi:hypothetical protein